MKFYMTVEVSELELHHGSWSTHMHESQNYQFKSKKQDADWYKQFDIIYVNFLNARNNTLFC